MSQGYVHPEYLVDTSWVAAHLNDPKVRIVESDEDYLLYDTGHIPGAVKVDWFTTLQHPLRRDFLGKQEFEKMCSELGIANDTTVVFYGDKSNWFACYAFWLFQYYGHKNVKIMNGGRLKWLRTPSWLQFDRSECLLPQLDERRPCGRQRFGEHDGQAE